jgi:hypothetical protein
MYLNREADASVPKALYAIRENQSARWDGAEDVIVEVPMDSAALNSPAYSTEVDLDSEGLSLDEASKQV